MQVENNRARGRIVKTTKLNYKKEKSKKLLIRESTASSQLEFVQEELAPSSMKMKKQFHPTDVCQFTEGMVQKMC